LTRLISIAVIKFNLEEADFVEMAQRLKRVKGKFLLSLNDTPEIRTIFKDFRVTSLQLAYSSQRKAGKKYGELFISNYPLPLETPKPKLG